MRRGGVRVTLLGLMRAFSSSLPFFLCPFLYFFLDFPNLRRYSPDSLTLFIPLTIFLTFPTTETEESTRTPFLNAGPTPSSSQAATTPPRSHIWSSKRQNWRIRTSILEGGFRAPRNSLSRGRKSWRLLGCVFFFLSFPPTPFSTPVSVWR